MWNVEARPHSSVRMWASVLLLAVCAGVALSWSDGWSLRSFLLPFGWLLTGGALFLVDRFLDQHIQGKRRKIVGPLPFWWVLVCMAPLGWGVGLLDDAASGPLPSWASAAVLVGLVAVSAAAFCLRFGLSPRS
jgi:hypothetical protein